MDDLDELARSLPGTTCERSSLGRPSYRVNGTLYCCHRGDRPDAVDEKGRRLDDVLMFRVADLEAKEMLLADTMGRFFTTPHFSGYPAVLLRIKDLRRVPKSELFELVADAWLTRAPKRVASAWLAERGL
jgi:hypothetical protein